MTPTLFRCQHQGGPRGIRTLDLLNAIETRSQLRYGPGLRLPERIAGQILETKSSQAFLQSCGPGGIRTRDLFSAIEARSQLRYRPPVAMIVSESAWAVKHR